MSFSLNRNQTKKIKEVFATHPEIVKVVLFGSRAKKTHRAGSDIDLALFGKKISHKDFLRLKKDLNELNLPYKFDPVIYSDISEKALRYHIDRVGIILFERGEKVS